MRICLGTNCTVQRLPICCRNPASLSQSQWACTLDGDLGNHFCSPNLRVSWYIFSKIIYILFLRLNWKLFNNLLRLLSHWACIAVNLFSVYVDGFNKTQFKVRLFWSFINIIILNMNMFQFLLKYKNITWYLWSGSTEMARPILMKSILHT